MENNMSIEQFAAYLDGNLSMDDSLIVSAAISQDTTLHDIVTSNDAIEDSLKYNTLSDLKIPDEILCMDFELPQVSNNSILQNEFESSQLHLSNAFEQLNRSLDGFPSIHFDDSSEFNKQTDSLSFNVGSIDMATNDETITDETSTDDNLTSLFDNGII